MTTGAVVSTFAGAATAGYTDATGTAARFSGPQQTAVDGSGNVYVADADNQVIRKITSSRVTTTVAGSGALGSADGVGTIATFNTPKALTLDSAGALYVGDNSNILRKVVLASTGQLAVGWSYGYDGDGSVLQNYSVTATSGGQPTRTCSVSNGVTSCLLTGLTSGSTYTITVTGTGASGVSIAAPTTTAVAP